MSQLFDIIAMEIASAKAIAFERFMQLALYCPEYGYYEREEDRIGQGGDFHTSVSVGRLFGELLAARFGGWLSSLDPPAGGKSLVLLEAGAHRGDLAADILSFYQRTNPSLFEKIEYWIVDPSASRRAWQARRLESFENRVRWFDQWPPDPICGVVFSNELLDAMPVRRVGWDSSQHHWFEFGVALDNGRFVWARLPGIVPAPLELPDSLLDLLPDGFVTEVSPAAQEWWSRAARALEQGWLMTCDYGLDALQFFTPERREGTLRSYFQHRMVADVLAQPGKQDITAQVNFSALQQAGELSGLKTGFTGSQEQFLVQILRDTEAGALAFEPWTPPRIREFKTLTHPQHFGRSFRVLVQQR